MRRSPLVLSPILAFCLLAGAAQAADLHIKLPKRSKPTAVQKLNQEGVKAIQKHKYELARKLFYQAYLLDANDPFTLNNLGYISELSGETDRAERFYSLAADNTSDATIAHASSDQVKGKLVSQVAGRAPDKQLQINRYNVQAIGLLMKDRAPEADLLLQQALALDTHNPFTLNNLGFAKEKEGELEQALVFYSRAANSNSSEPVVVTVNKEWRGRPISEVAAENVKKLRKLMANDETLSARVARLNLEGVSAMNRNDHAAARRYFEQAYKLDPNDAFTLNNMGYLAEMDADRETAEFYYQKAAEAKRSDARVTFATRREVEGKPVGQVAEIGDQKVTQSMEAQREARRRQGGPILLRRRDNTPVVEPERPPQPQQQPQSNLQGNPGELMQPLPDNQQPPAAPQPPKNPPPQN